MKLPIDIREITNLSKKAREEREQPLRVAVFVDPDTPDELLDGVRTRLTPQTSLARLHIAIAEPGLRLTLAPDVDTVIALLGSGTESMRASIAEARERYVPTAALALGEDREIVATRLGHPILDTLVDEDVDHLIDDLLGEWLADRLSGKRLALATNFAFMRRAVAEESVKTTAFQNGVIGVVVILPGADMPLMTANQAKMLLQIAAAYGEPLGKERIKELAAVVGGGFALRAIARQALAFVPGIGWAVKGGVSYAGTLAMGQAAIAYFERGADFGEVLREARDARDRAVAEIHARTRRGERSQERGTVPPPLSAGLPSGESDTGGQTATGASGVYGGESASSGGA